MQNSETVILGERESFCVKKMNQNVLIVKDTLMHGCEPTWNISRSSWQASLSERVQIGHYRKKIPSVNSPRYQVAREPRVFEEDQTTDWAHSRIQVTQEKCIR